MTVIDIDLFGKDKGLARGTTQPAQDIACLGKESVEQSRLHSGHYPN